MYFLLGNISDIFGGMLAIIGGLIIIAVIILLVVVGIIIAFLPTIIAFRRGHYYKWIIFAINFVCGVTGIGYLVALVWAFWPEKSTFTDVFHNDATTNSKSSNIDIFSKRTFTKKIESDMTSVHILKDGNQQGPFSVTEIVEMLTKNEITYSCMCWYKGKSAWSSISECANDLNIPPEP